MTFLFDIGKVIVDFDFESSLFPLAARTGRDPMSAIAPLLTRKDDFERGLMSLDDFVTEALDALGPAVKRDVFIDAWRGIFTPNRPMWQVIENLADHGHRLLLFSNINPIHWPWLAEEFSIFRHFESGTFSYRTGAIKPESAIFQYAIDRHQILPQTTRYIDDLAANVDAGRALGFRCHHYDLNDHDSFEKWLRDELQISGASVPTH